MPLTTFITTTVVPAARLPVAAFVADPAFGVVGSVVQLDGRISTDPDNSPLSYTWRFLSVPIGSQVEGEDFRTLDTDSFTNSPCLVSFSPDFVGTYVVGLVVSNGVFDSVEVINVISIGAILIPHGRGIVPDGKFIWSYIRDVWSQVDSKEFFETLWSALIQITGSEMLKLYQVDFNKSIRDIQDLYQRRWLSYEPKLLLDQSALTFYIGNQSAGQDASTVNLGLEGIAVILAPNEVVVILGARLQNVSGETLTILYSQDPSNIGDFELQGLNGSRNGYKLVSPDLSPTADTIGVDIRWDFTLGSVNWQMESTGDLGEEPAVTLSEFAPLSDTILPFFRRLTGGLDNGIQKGDVIHYPSGPNAGYYRILNKSGPFVTVDHAPASFADSTTVGASTVYRPVGFKVTQPAVVKTNTFSVPYVPGANDLSVLAPGRLVVVNGQTYTVLSSVIDPNQIVPLVVVTVDSTELLAGIRSLNWRAPATVISASQDFETLGLATGDLVGFDVILEGTELTSSVVGQVVGVEGGAFGFVFTNGVVVAGEVPAIPNATILQLATDFGIDGVTVSQDGEIVYSGTALAFVQSISSGAFKKAYWNQPLTPDSDISVNPLFQLRPSYVIRNRLIPIDPDLLSIPTLQEWIVQPTVTTKDDGKIYQNVRGQDFELTHLPVVLTENLEYILDDEFPFVGAMTINTGSATIQVDNADFIDRSIAVGDSFIINEPLTLVGEYLIQEVVSNSEIVLNRPVPAYVFGTFANAQVTLKRKKTGNFLRFVPGLFTSQNPAPDRLWAEVSFFDNDQTVEDNFGILVGLTRDTLESVSTDINYRQAVSGLMFAFTQGSALDQVRLGAQILLGLPFAEHKGILRSIEPDYRLDNTGAPILGRLLVEDIDDTGAPLGTLRIYIYPIDPASELAGIDTNPATNEPYVVGDTVELFAPLSKGVEILDYVSDPLDPNFSAIAQLQQYHSVKLRANDNIFNLNELGLVSDFLRKITPSYVSFSLITASEFADSVSIQDFLFEGFSLGGAGNFVDNASLRISPTLMFDSRSSSDGLNQMAWDSGANWVRRKGSDGVLGATGFTNECTLSTAAGGIRNQKTGEKIQSPITKNGDLLIILTGSCVGSYPISEVVDDNSIIALGPSNGFPVESDVIFMICRPNIGDLYDTSVTFTSGASFMTFVGGGLRTAGVAPGDWVIVDDGQAGYRHLVVDVRESVPGSGNWNIADVTPNTAFATSSPAICSIFRPPQLDDIVFEITADGSNAVRLTSGGNYQTLLSIGDEFVIQDTPDNLRYTILDPALNHATNAVYVTPPMPAGVYELGVVAFKGKAATDIGWDHIEKYDPTDAVEVSLVEDQALAACIATTFTVSLQMQRTTTPTSGPSAFNPQADGVRPGDLLALTSGVNGSVDVGYGPGVYPIVAVSSSNVRLSRALGTTESDSWKIIRRR